MIFIEEKFACKKKVRYEFTYLDYLYYCDRETWKKIVNGEYPTSDDEEKTICVKEESTEYELKEDKKGRKTGDKKHDKIFKDILQNKEEIARFINKFTNYEMNVEELEIYNPNYITEKFEYKNADIPEGERKVLLLRAASSFVKALSGRIILRKFSAVESVGSGLWIYILSPFS